MKLSAIIFSNVLLAATVLAAPASLARRTELRANGTRASNPLIDTDGPQTGIYTNASNIAYSGNWAGAVYTAPPAGQTFNAVSGRFRVPTPSAPASGDGTWAASAWVGIDGDTYGAAILQTGVDVSVTRSGGKISHSYSAWYEWFPAGAADFDLEICAGDVISMSVVAKSPSEGTAHIENLTTGKSVRKTFTAPTSSSHLGGRNAEWIVEDFSSGGSFVPFADFGTVEFTHCHARTPQQKIGVSGASVIEIYQNNKVLSDVSFPSSTEVKVVYK